MFSIQDEGSLTCDYKVCILYLILFQGKMWIYMNNIVGVVRCIVSASHCSIQTLQKRIHNELHNRAITQIIQTSGMSKMSHESDISMLVVLIIMAGLYCLCCASVWLLLLCNTLYTLVWKNSYAKYLS